ncbi:MAG: exodeoxyribonuclease VII small subunit [Anaerovoracaceae bacterium]
MGKEKNEQTEENKMTFEEAYSNLQKIADDMKKPGASLEDSIKRYEQGMEYYRKCREILDSAKQKIEVIKEETKFED